MCDTGTLTGLHPHEQAASTVYTRTLVLSMYKDVALERKVLFRLHPLFALALVRRYGSNKTYLLMDCEVLACPSEVRQQR